MRKDNPGLGGNTASFYSPAIANVSVLVDLDGMLREDSALPWERGPWLRQYLTRIRHQHQTLYARSVTQSPANKDAGLLASIELALEKVTPAPETDPVVKDFMASHVTAKKRRKRGKMPNRKELESLKRRGYEMTSFTLPTDRHVQLKKLAEERGQSMGEITRIALEEYLQQPMNYPRKTRGKGWKIRDRRASANS